MPLQIALALLLVMNNRVEPTSVGLIRDVSLVGQQGIQIYQTSCEQCACALLLNTSFVSLNCYKANGTCELFTSYNVTIEYTVKDDINSCFYFNELPPLVPSTATPGATAVDTQTKANSDAGKLIDTTHCYTSSTMSV